MRGRLIASSVVVAIAIAVAVATLHGAPRALGPNPVVVELFTSQG